MAAQAKGCEHFYIGDGKRAGLSPRKEVAGPSQTLPSQGGGLAEASRGVSSALACFPEPAYQCESSGLRLVNQTLNQCGSSLEERATGKGYGEEGGMQLTGRTPQVEQVARLMGQEGTQIPGANEGRGPSTDPWCSQQFPNFGGDRMGQMRL